MNNQSVRICAAMVLIPCMLAGCGRKEDVVSPDIDVGAGTSMVFTAGSPAGLKLYKVQGGRIRRYSRISVPDNSSIAVTSDDVSKTRVAVTRKGEISMIDGEKETRISPLTWHCYGPAFGPAHDQVFFVRSHRLRPYSHGGYVYDQDDLYLRKSQREAPVRLTHNEFYRMGQPRVIGSTCYFAATPAGENKDQVYRLELSKGSKPVAITEIKDGQFGLDVDRQNRHIVFIQGEFSPWCSHYVWNLYLANTDGTDVRQLTKKQSIVFTPRFSRDGKSIIFLSQKGLDGPFSLWRIDVTGNNERMIADSSLFTDPESAGKIEW